MVRLNRYFWDSLIRFHIGRTNPEWLKKLDEQSQKDRQDHIEQIARQRGIKVRVIEREQFS